MYIDSHTHLSSEYYNNIDEVINRAYKNKVEYLIVSCCSIPEIKEGLKYIVKYQNIFLTVGLHPQETENYTDNDIKWIESLIKNNNRIIGIGEIGLDYYYGKENSIEQKKLFIAQLELAKKLSSPVVIHTRDATEDTLNILKNYNLNGIIHCFNGSIETANQYIKLGYKLGIGGVLTFKNSKLSSVVKKIPLSSIVLETDSPYLTPEPFRGNKNESKNIPIIAEKVANVKGLKIEEVENQTTNNVATIFDLKNILWYILFGIIEVSFLKRKILLIKTQSIFLLTVVLIILIIGFSNPSAVIITEDISNARSIKAIHLVSKYNKNIVKTKTVQSFSEVLEYGNKMPVKFNGIMTGYGPDCVGCGGKTGCPPRQNVRNGNVYFNDKDYGKINIVATDSRIPCGSILKITNSTLGKEVTAIALDRGGAIKSTKVDFLVESEKKALTTVGKQKVTFEIVRWGW